LLLNLILCPAVLAINMDDIANGNDAVSEDLISANPGTLSPEAAALTNRTAAGTGTAGRGTAATAAVSLNAQDHNILALISVLEETACVEGRLDVVQVMFNRVNDSLWPNTITGVAFQRGQFEPFFNTSAANVATEGKAAQFLARARGMSYRTALASLQQIKRDMANADKMKAARDFVGGRAYFKGVSQYRNRKSGDPRRRHGCNYYHTERSDNATNMKQRVNKAPLVVNGPAR